MAEGGKADLGDRVTFPYRFLVKKHGRGYRENLGHRKLKKESLKRGSLFKSGGNQKTRVDLHGQYL